MLYMYYVHLFIPDICIDIHLWECKYIFMHTGIYVSMQCVYVGRYAWIYLCRHMYLHVHMYIKCVCKYRCVLRLRYIWMYVWIHIWDSSVARQWSQVQYLLLIQHGWGLTQPSIPLWVDKMSTSKHKVGQHLH